VKRILIAEDEPSIVLSLEFLLTNAGYAVAVARHGTEALRLVEELQPDLVVLDIMLPAVNGFEVCRRIREDPRLAHIRILMLTARGRDTEVRKGRALGADAYMTKPFATRELVATVNHLLGRPAGA
jgi:two-component system, OmpR family, alkaline phosphatase synthesis response regulator PhoP